MLERTIAGTNVHFDGQGFMTDYAEWSPAIAEELARELQIELGATHWQIVNFAREDFSSTGKSPGLRRIAVQTKVPMKQIYQLFPKGPGKLVARIAGVPKPKSCL